MIDQKVIQDIEQLVALADLLIDKGTKLKQKMLQVKVKMAGVSTPASRKGKVDRKVIDGVIARRNARMGKKGSALLSKAN